MDGTGVNVYIIDTGVSPDHVDFGGVGGRCEMSYDAVGGVVSELRCILQLFSPAYPGGAKGARAPHGSETKTVESACFWLIFI